METEQIIKDLSNILEIDYLNIDTQSFSRYGSYPENITKIPKDKLPLVEEYLQKLFKAQKMEWMFLNVEIEREKQYSAKTIRYNAVYFKDYLEKYPIDTLKIFSITIANLEVTKYDENFELIPQLNPKKELHLFFKFAYTPYEQEEPPSQMVTNLKGLLDKDNYNKLLKSGMFFEFHPELTGNFTKDTYIILNKLKNL